MLIGVLAVVLLKYGVTLKLRNPSESVFMAKKKLEI